MNYCTPASLHFFPPALHQNVKEDQVNAQKYLFEAPFRDDSSNRRPRSSSFGPAVGRRRRGIHLRSRRVREGLWATTHCSRWRGNIYGAMCFQHECSPHLQSHTRSSRRGKRRLISGLSWLVSAPCAASVFGIKAFSRGCFCCYNFSIKWDR